MAKEIIRYLVSATNRYYGTLEPAGNNHHQGDSVLAVHRAGANLYTPINGYWVEVVPTNPRRCPDPEHDLSVAFDLMPTGRRYPIGAGEVVVIDGREWQVCVPWSDLNSEGLIVADDEWEPGCLLPEVAQ